MHSEYSINGFGKAGRKRLFSRMALFVVVAALFTAAALSPALASRGLSVRPVAPDGKIVSGNNWLFVIGINDYQHWPKLKTAVNDAKAVKEVLVSRYDFEADHVIELYDRDATEAAIIARLRALASQVKENDSLLIFYAGHGHLDSITKEGSWVPVESATDNASAWISNHSVKNYLKVDAIRARHILLVSDSCFSGGFFRGQRGSLPAVTPALIKKAWQRASRQAISSGGLEPVADAGFGDHSVFSHFFIKALKENRRPYLIPSDLFAEVRAGVAQNAEQFPSLGVLSDTGGQAGGEFVFMLRQAARIEDLSAAEQDKMKELEALRALEKQARLAEEQEKREIAAKEQELAALDAKIAAMQQRLGTSAQTGSDSLDTMLAMVRQKESEQQKIEALKKQKAAEEAKRQAEIDRLKKEQMNKARAALEADIKKYREIANSEFGKSMAESAWNSMVQKYAPGKTVAQGNEIRLFEEAIGARPTPFVNDLGMAFVYIQPSSFLMGSPTGFLGGIGEEYGRSSDERQHQVTLTRGFYMQTTEVTQGQWQAIMGSNPSYFSSCGDNCPVEQVSWNDVQEFIRKLNQRTGKEYRLPTEAEWEYACRAGSTGPYSWGNSIDCSKANYGNGLSSDCKGQNPGKTMKVGSFSPNAWGLYDMHGNVWEWCQDWFGEYPLGSVADPAGPSSGLYRVIRGGSWFGFRHSSWFPDALFCRSATRFGNEPGNRNYFLGFRLVCLSGR